MRTAGTQDKDGGLWRPCQDLIARFGSRMCKSIIKSELGGLPARVRRTWFGSGTAGGRVVARVGQNRTGTSALESFEINVRLVLPRCATGR